MSSNAPSSLIVRLPLLVGALFLSSAVAAGDWSGNLGVESRIFFDSDANGDGANSNLSTYIEAEYYHAADDGINNFVFTPFVRYDENDDERSHADLREASWIAYADTFELRVGLNKVFWGVTESRHLVDIINQTDAVENSDGEDKLGQPMVNLTWLTDEAGTFDFFYMPYFRERTFAGPNGRPSLPLRVLIDDPVYESSDEDENNDLAIRWSHSFDIWDIGISHFNGTSRDPRLVVGFDDGEAVLIPHYDQIAQTGIDAQATTEDWLWKVEAISVKTDNQDDYSAAVAGFEYTFVGIFDSDADLGVIAEYLYDEREDSEPFQDDIMAGLRWVLNDEQSTEVLFGLIADQDGGGIAYNLEAARRLGDSFKLDIEMRIISDADDDPVLGGSADDDFLQIELGYYF
ncbi:MAG: hypothetical protein AAF385_17225 [Pseudomonadota bacterium]